jgi:L-arabinose isomerase
MEDYTYNLEPGKELILGAHMLEVNAALSSAKARLVIAPLGIGGREDPVRLVFTADAGPAIVVAMSDQRERFRLVANVVDNVPLPAPMPNLPVGHAVWKPRPDFRTSATCWLMSGAAHHTVMSNQIGLDVIREFARLSRIELLVIDESTSVVAFEYGLRSNAAYYRLSQGL